MVAAIVIVWQFELPFCNRYFAYAMNKAFTKETDSDDDDLVAPLAQVAGRNYITPSGYEQLRSELLGLIDDERPKIVEVVHWAASNGDRSENGDCIYGKNACVKLTGAYGF